ncbi:hypothetical protein ACI79X_19300 [Geodermatophilus sp. SYSU D01119]
MSTAHRCTGQACACAPASRPVATAVVRRRPRWGTGPTGGDAQVTDR